jgi:hypothetical protein
MPKASKHKLYTLPSNFNEMNKFIEVNKIQLMEHIVASIEYAIDKKLSFVEIFSFKNSDFVVTLPTNQFKEIGNGLSFPSSNDRRHQLKLNGNIQLGIFDFFAVDLFYRDLFSRLVFRRFILASNRNSYLMCF